MRSPHEIGLSLSVDQALRKVLVRLRCDYGILKIKGDQDSSVFSLNSWNTNFAGSSESFSKALCEYDIFVEFVSASTLWQGWKRNVRCCVAKDVAQKYLSVGTCVQGYAILEAVQVLLIVWRQLKSNVLVEEGKRYIYKMNNNFLAL